MNGKVVGAGLILVAAFLFSVPARAADMDSILQYGGLTRDYIVHTPPQYKSDGGPVLPVVLALHGGGGSAQGMKEMYGLDAYADRAGMIMVYPDAIPSAIGSFHTCNAGGCCGPAKKEGVDDTGFIAAVVDAVVSTYHADAKHVFVTGHSNGAMMAYRLACEIPGKIAAIAPVSGQSVFPCPQTSPVPVLHIHGTLDICALYSGGLCGGCFADALGLPGADKKWPCEGVQKSLARRAQSYGCGAGMETVFTRGPVDCERWKGCPDSGTVALCSVRGGGHHWQGARLPEACEKKPGSEFCRRWLNEVGPVLGGVDYGGIIFDFFSDQVQRFPASR